MSIVIALDEGTTNAKAIAIDDGGTVLASVSRPIGIVNRGGGEVEQDAAELWQASLACIAECLAKVDVADVVGIAISNQRESVVAWDPSTGRAVGPVLSWQDTRTAGVTAAISAADAAAVRAATGLPVDPMFSAPKASWLLAHAPAGARVGTVDSWLVWNLTGGAHHVTEPGNASRTLLFGLESLAWEDALLALFEIPRGALAEVVSSTGPFGVTACAGLPAGLPILAVLADSHAALRGHGGGQPEVVKATYGTGSSVMRGTGSAILRCEGVATTLAWHDGTPTYALEGNIRYSGSALDWAARLLGVADARALGELAGTVADAGGVTLVPAFGGLGAPHWDPEAVGLLSGLTAGSSAAHVAMAAFDAVAMQVADVVEAMSVGSGAPSELRCDGGATASALLMGLQADALGCDVVVVGEADVALRGVAALAFSTIGVTLLPVTATSVYRPAIDASVRRGRRATWAHELNRARQ